MVGRGVGNKNPNGGTFEKEEENEMKMK